MLKTNRLKRMSEIGGILLYVIPAAYLFLSATLFQFTILTDLTKAIQKQNPAVAYHQETVAFLPSPLADNSIEEKASPLIPASKSIYMYFLVMTALVMSVIILKLFGQSLQYILKEFYQFISLPAAQPCIPSLRAPPSL